MKSNSSKWIIGLVVILVIIVALVANSKNSSGESITIGYYGPFTGPVAGTTGDDAANGFKLAHSERHTIAGKDIKVIYEDEACDPQKGVAAANKLINIDKVKVIFSGVCSGSTLAGAAVAEKSKVILFTPISVSPKLTSAGDYIFRTSASAVVSGEVINKWLNDSGYKKIVILYESAEYPTSIKDVVSEKFPKTPGNSILAVEGSKANEVDFRSQLTKISNLKPDAYLIVMNSTITANAVLKQRAELQIKGPVIGNEYFIQKEVLANPDSEGVYSSTYKYDPTSKPFVDFIKKYVDTYKKTPSQDIYPALAYDGYNVLFDAMEKCGGDDADCIKGELYKVQMYPGITGTISIDENGDTQREFVIKKIVGGQITDNK